MKFTRTRPRFFGRPPPQAGVSLVEVLVAIVVLSIGLLGLAGLQASGMRVGQSSVHRSLAAQMAYDIVDRMRVNLPNAAGYAISLTAAAPAPNTCAGAVACLDLADWRGRLEAMMPAGTGSVAVNGSEVTVVVQWDDSRGAAAASTAQFQLTAQLAQ